MELNSYFEPIDTDVVEYHRDKYNSRLGDVIIAHTINNGFPDLDGIDIAIVGVKEDRGSVNNRGCAKAPDMVRRELYRLAKPHDKLRIVDLGNIEAGATLNDTYIAMIEALHLIIEYGITIVLIGGSNDLLFGIYKAYELVGRVINICSIDSHFDIEGGEDINSNNYLQHIILQQPNYLFDYVAMGYQTYFVGQEMVNFMDELKFTTRRVGELQTNMDRAEPPIRYSDVVCIDVSAVRQSDAPGQSHPSPHGLYGEELCQIARFAGMSDKNSCIAFTEMNPAYDHRETTASMLAQAIWFFLEGYYYRMGDFPARDKTQYKRFTTIMSENGMEIVFYKSLRSDRWWMEVPCEQDERREKYLRHTLIPCNYSDYQLAMENEIPELWWHYYNRINN